MQVTLKNLKICNFASEETICFQATVYVDGKKAGTAQNDGKGGCTFCHLDPAFRHLDNGKKYDAPCCTDPNCYWCKGTNVRKYSFDDLVDNEVFRMNDEKIRTETENKMRKKGFKFIAHFSASSEAYRVNTEAEVRAIIAKDHPDVKEYRLVKLCDTDLDEIRNLAYEKKVAKQGYKYVLYCEGGRIFATGNHGTPDEVRKIIEAKHNTKVKNIVELYEGHNNPFANRH